MLREEAGNFYPLAFNTALLDNSMYHCDSAFNKLLVKYRYKNSQFAEYKVLIQDKYILYNRL